MLYQIKSKEETAIQVFGHWDYLSHQVVASPFKPVDYMDKMDVFGYRFITGFQPTKSKYLVAELKKDVAKEADLEQLMKYVDWVRSEYAYGDYNMIEAFLVAYGFDETVLAQKKFIGVRNFTIGMKPAESYEWRNITLIKYNYDNDLNKIAFSIIT